MIKGQQLRLLLSVQVDWKYSGFGYVKNYNHLNLSKRISERAGSGAEWDEICQSVERVVSGFGSVSPEWWSGNPGQSWSGEWEF